MQNLTVTGAACYRKHYWKETDHRLMKSFHNCRQLSLSDSDKRHICHLTSVHPRYDTRIFLKECRSLARAGYKVSLVVADGNGDEFREGVTIYDVGPAKNRLDRMANTTKRVFIKAASLNAGIYHLHDPELLSAGLKLKNLRKKVIFDSHEDVPKQIFSKFYFNRPSRWLAAQVLAVYEALACRRFDAIVATTPFIREKFLGINPLTVEVCNFPIPGELQAASGWHSKQQAVCYVGGIDENRGIREMVLAMSMLKCGARLQLGGLFSEPETEAEVKGYAGWSRVDALGYLDRAGVRDVLARSVGGMVTLMSTPNHNIALPIKMFEYMSAGIPVIASHFPLWRDIIKKNDCGICVDPYKPSEIASAIDFLISHPDKAEQMGKNGLLAVQNRYNWSIEEEKLLSLYQRLSA